MTARELIEKLIMFDLNDEIIIIDRNDDELEIDCIEKSLSSSNEIYIVCI